MWNVRMNEAAGREAGRHFGKRAMMQHTSVVRASIQGPPDSSIIPADVSEVVTGLEVLDVGECPSEPVTGSVG